VGAQAPHQVPTIDEHLLTSRLDQYSSDDAWGVLQVPDRTNGAKPRIERQAIRVRVPRRLLTRDIGLGTLLRRLATTLRISPCLGCVERAEALDRRIVITGSSGPPPPKPGCWFAGTNCYGFIQTLKFCCRDGTEYTERYGWCIGFWREPPCTPFRPG
jgi:hypothetical protein